MTLAFWNGLLQIIGERASYGYPSAVRERLSLCLLTPRGIKLTSCIVSRLIIGSSCDIGLQDGAFNYRGRAFPARESASTFPEGVRA